MFRQFLDKVTGSEVYLITSLGIFLLFFILVGVMLITMKKDHVKKMSELPLVNDKN